MYGIYFFEEFVDIKRRFQWKGSMFCILIYKLKQEFFFNNKECVWEDKVEYMGKYNFDKVISRKGTYSAKWQGYEKKFSGYDVKNALCMWVADMDFLCPVEVISA